MDAVCKDQEQRLVCGATTPWGEKRTLKPCLCHSILVVFPQYSFLPTVTPHGDTGAPPLTADGLRESVCAATRGAGALRAFWWRPGASRGRLAALAASRGRFDRMLFKGFSDRRPVMPKEKSNERGPVKTNMYTYTDDQRYECKHNKNYKHIHHHQFSKNLAIPRKLRVSASALEFIWMCRFLDPICLVQHDSARHHADNKTFLQHADSLILSNEKR